MTFFGTAAEGLALDSKVGFASSLVLLLGPLSKSPPISPNCSFERPNFSSAGQTELFVESSWENCLWNPLVCFFQENSSVILRNWLFWHCCFIWGSDTLHVTHTDLRAFILAISAHFGFAVPGSGSRNTWNFWKLWNFRKCWNFWKAQRFLRGAVSPSPSLHTTPNNFAFRSFLWWQDRVLLRFGT